MTTTSTPKRKRLSIGRIVTTAGVHQIMKSSPKFHDFALESLNRHADGDWGDVCEEDKGLNDSAVENDDSRVLSSYGEGTDQHLWIITEWDRSVTTLLFPFEY